MKLKFNAKGITGLLLCIIIWGCDNYSELKDVLQKRNDELTLMVIEHFAITLEILNSHIYLNP